MENRIDCVLFATTTADAYEQINEFYKCTNQYPMSVVILNLGRYFYIEEGTGATLRAAGAEIAVGYIRKKHKKAEGEAERQVEAVSGPLMAVYGVTHSCGHEQRVSFHERHKVNHTITLKKLSDTPCAVCLAQGRG